MAITKRLRFEILRRDNHACRYCGGIAPEAILTVDHVVPVALGGSDDPTNLVAACKDCNSGKSASPADAHHVAEVTQDAFRWAAAMRAAFDEAIAEIDRKDSYVGEFFDAWDAWTYGTMSKKVPLPPGWEQSVAKWYGLGVPIEILRDAVTGAMNKRGFNLPGEHVQFRYMAGIVWKTLTELQQQVAAQLSVPKHQTPKGDPHCDQEDCSWHGDDERRLCTVCNLPNCDWACGYEAGEWVGWNACYSGHSYEIYVARELSRVCYDAGAEPIF